MSQHDFVPVNEPLLDGNEKKYLAECIDTGWISSEGPFVREFENAMAKRFGREFGIAVCNGTAALDVAFAAVEIQPGDEVIVPTFTIISCVHHILRSGARPVFVDCDPETWNLQVEDVENLITDKTTGILAVHIYGLPVDMQPLLDLADRHGLWLIEDAAESIGQHYKNQACGSFGNLSTLSFYPNKHVTTGEGGMVLTDDPVLADRCRSLRNLCFQKKQRFLHEELGWNYRMTNLQAALGLAQLERLDQTLDRKRAIGDFYNQSFGELEAAQLPVAVTHYAQNLYWVYGLVLNESVDFDAATVMKLLAEQGIGSRPFFWPLHEQPVIRKMGLDQPNGSFPIAEKIARRGFYIPSGIGTPTEDLVVVSEVVREILQ